MHPITAKGISLWAKRLWMAYCDRENRWLTVPCTVAALLVLLVLVKSCQGIIYNYTDECRVYKLGYSIEQARVLTTVLSHEQIDSLIARHEYDTIAYPLLYSRYFIVENFDRYLAYHKVDTTGAPIADIVASVNVGKDLGSKRSAAPCDTSKGNLMLVNRYHYLDEQYKPQHLATFDKKCTYEEQKALPAVVDAFMAMRQECKRQTNARLMVNSAYRSYSQQIATYKRNDKRYVAHAGFSEHQTGLAIDVTSLEHPMRWPFDTSTEGVWMRENCHQFGFVLRYPKDPRNIMNYSYEPWHLRYVGVETAKRIHDEGITFDEYYAFYVERETK